MPQKNIFMIFFRIIFKNFIFVSFKRFFKKNKVIFGLLGYIFQIA